jgi:hypothetical protein
MAVVLITGTTSMTLDPGRVPVLFLTTLEQETSGVRAAVLNRECAANDGLRCRVESLPIAYDQPDSLLDRSLIANGEILVARKRKLCADLPRMAETLTPLSAILVTRRRWAGAEPLFRASLVNWAGERVAQLYESTGRKEMAAEWRARMKVFANCSEAKP